MPRLAKAAGRDGGSRNVKALFWLLYLPLLVLVAAFAAANRQDVDISLDPLPFGLTVPLFLVVLASVLVGLVAGGVSSWLSGWHWRRSARRLCRSSALLETEVAALRDKLETGAAPVAESRQRASPAPSGRGVRRGTGQARGDAA